MSLVMKSMMAGQVHGASTTQLRGNGPCVVLVGVTNAERLRVTVTPSGKYLIEIVDADGKPSGSMFKLHRRTRSGGPVPILRKRIKGVLSR